MSTSDPAIEALGNRLKAIAPNGQFALAFSGGFDSRFLAFCALRLGFTPRLLIADGSQVARSDIKAAHEAATALGIQLETIQFEACHIPELIQAGRQRCYLCKRAMFTLFLSHCDGLPLCDGTNASDLHGFRPGRKALEELGIFSPLAESAMTKPLERRLALAMGMPQPQQASRPCLLTRFPYGTMPDVQQLRLIDDVEETANKELRETVVGLRLRFPSPAHPVLHIKLKEGTVLAKSAPLRLAKALEERFSPRLTGLTVSAVENLSGFFDRPA